ncbi:MAG TPA: hypothetical protein VF719_01460 [Abditibacteriaceae bacterium]
MLEPWRGQRVLLLLPLQLGEGWNVDRAFGTALLPDAEQALQDMLQKTGKFSVIEPHRFNPILQRATQEKRITTDQLTTLVTTPTLENARIVLSKIAFDQPPMIAQFVLEEMRFSGADKNAKVQLQVSGRLYELGNPVAIKSTVITSNAQNASRVSVGTLAAANDAFARSIAEFVAPIPEIQVVPPAPVAPTPVVTPTPVVPVPVVPVAPVVTVPLPGDVAIAGSSSRNPSDLVPQLPAPMPPLGINVPNSPSTGR